MRELIPSVSEKRYGSTSCKVLQVEKKNQISKIFSPKLIAKIEDFSTCLELTFLSFSLLKKENKRP